MNNIKNYEEQINKCYSKLSNSYDNLKCKICSIEDQTTIINKFSGIDRDKIYNSTNKNINVVNTIKASLNETKKEIINRYNFLNEEKRAYELLTEIINNRNVLENNDTLTDNAKNKIEKNIANKLSKLSSKFNSEINEALNAREFSNDNISRKAINFEKDYESIKNHKNIDFDNAKIKEYAIKEFNKAYADLTNEKSYFLAIERKLRTLPVNEYYKNDCAYTLTSLNNLSQAYNNGINSDIDKLTNTLKSETETEINKMNLENYRAKANYIKAKYNYNKKYIQEKEIVKISDKASKKTFLESIKEGLISCGNIGQAIVAPNPNKKTK